MVHHSQQRTERDNDKHQTANCAEAYLGAWWYTACHSSNLNGYNYNRDDLPENPTYYAKGIIWRNEKNVAEQDYYFSWPKVEMKIRKRNCWCALLRWINQVYHSKFSLFFDVVVEKSIFSRPNRIHPFFHHMHMRQIEHLWKRRQDDTLLHTTIISNINNPVRWWSLSQSKACAEDKNNRLRQNSSHVNERENNWPRGFQHQFSNFKSFEIRN